MRRFSLVWLAAALVGAGVGWACAADAPGSDCTIGAKGCECTVGGACDFELTCVDGVCIQINAPSDDDGETGPDDAQDSPNDEDTPDDDTPDDADTTAGDTSDEGPTGDEGPLLDVGSNTTGVNTAGCQAIDVLFVLDASGSMGPERASLAATNAFTEIVMTLQGLNGGGIEYRIGVTDDHGQAWFTPAGWFEPDPWFDSEALSPAEVAAAFNGAVAQIDALPEPPLGCEHVLSSAVSLLDNDSTGFLRESALLVLILVTDVDDYGAYDQPSGNACGLGCGVAAPPVATLHSTLLGLKGDVPEALAAVIVAGDPSVNGGVNFCDQPGVCCSSPGLECEVFHGTRLWEFAALLNGTNGHTANLCSITVPMAVETALTESIDIACQEFEPEG